MLSKRRNPQTDSTAYGILSLLSIESSYKAVVFPQLFKYTEVFLIIFFKHFEG
jgi:hypothetical protein